MVEAGIYDLKPPVETITQVAQPTGSIAVVLRGRCDTFFARLHRCVQVGHVTESVEPGSEPLAEIFFE